MQSLENESSLSSDDAKEDPDFGLPKTQKKKEKAFKKSDLLLVSILMPLSGVKPSVWWQTNIVLAIEG